MSKRILGLLAVMALVFHAPVWAGGGGKTGFRDMVQQKIETQSSNIQYEPYYLQSVSNAEVMDTSQEFWGDTDKVEEKSKDSARCSRRKQTAKTQEPREAINPFHSRYAIYQTQYTAELEENVVIINGKIVFEVFEKGWTRLPLMGTDVGLLDVSVNRGSSFVVMHGGKYHLMLERPGRYTLNLEFLIKANREREFGPGNFNFEVIPAPISQFEFIIPEKEVEIFVEPAIKVETRHEGDKTIAWAVMPNTQGISARWTKAIPKEDIQPVELEPKVYADTTTNVSIGEGLIRSETTLNYSILQSEISGFRIALPQDVSLLDVRGKDLRDWKVTKADGMLYLDVYLNFGTRGTYTLTLSYERNIGEGSVVADIPWVRTVGTERETGYFGIAARTNVELAVSKAEHVSAIDVKELPSAIWGGSSNPILLAFKYLNHPFQITIDVTRHEEMPVLVAAIDSADFFSLQTKDGKVLTRATYQVRNNVKQFLRLVLPEESTLWSTFVAGKPVKPAKDQNGSILVPLEKSRMQGESLTGFPVEVVYLKENEKMGPLGQIKMNLPRVDIPISEIQWSVYLPSEYSYFNFGGDVKLERGRHRPLLEAVGLTRGIQGRLRSATDDIGEQFSVANQARREQRGYQVSTYTAELESIRNKGILPIKISLPARGQHFRFVKLLVTEQESPTLTLSYTDIIKKYGGWVFKSLIILAILYLIRSLRNRRRNKVSVQKTA